MPNKAFLEITNACNLACDFCHGTKREIRYITSEEFVTAAKKLRTFADYLYFHLMGEPLLHPKLAEFLSCAGELGFKVILTTNGTLLKKRTGELVGATSLHKVSISLHAYEANAMGMSIEEYLSDCFDFCDRAAAKGKIAVMRLWNAGGAESMNSRILDAMHAHFAGEWKEIYSGYKLAERIFLEWGDKFEWPDLDAPDYGSSHSCYGLRDQIGVLSDGTVVPCCLDAEGAIPLGNIFTDDIDSIISSERALAIKTSFEKKAVIEPLCRRCGYAAKKRK